MNALINTVVASAGAGKTTRIVGDIAREVEIRQPEEIVATTFTVKAADELIERSRANLFKAGKAEQAARLLGARFGTVNSICGQIVGEHAIDLGRSPRAEIIPEDGVARLFAIAAEGAIQRHAPELNRLAGVMGYFEPKRAQDAERYDWRSTLRRLIELARANGLDASGLAHSANRSIETFLPLLPTSASSGDAFDKALCDAVAGALPIFPAVLGNDGNAALGLLRPINTALQRGEALSWPDWARLSKVKCAKKDGQPLIDALDAVARAAARHPEHPRLRADCVGFIRTLFTCAGEALAAFQDYKADRGLLDFTDQEALALQVLRDPAIAGRVGERISRVFVDEFQDCSPLQIAIFSAMADLVEVSTWVGDPKQAIYGFRDTDSSLTMTAFGNADSTLSQAAFDRAEPSATGRTVLATSYRSRKGIIDFVNAAFGPAFTAMGLPAADNAFSGTARTEDGFAHAPFAVWWLEGKIDLQYAALAAGIRDAINDGADWTVFDKEAKANRPLRAGDVAVLCRSHADILRVATALSQLGVKVAVERDGLSRTPHVELVMAAFRWVADPTDRLALAELARFFSDDPQSDLWLQAVSAADQDTALQAAVPISPALNALRESVLSLTPADLVDALIVLPDVIRRIETWGDVAARLDDLEALRGFARTYEASCASSGAPATPSGLVLALATDEPRRPKSLQSNAVKVMTYHGAKGLEWPLVVLTGLNREPKPRLFEPVAEADGALDWRDPLAGRWIRYWPWPYASQSKDVGLDEAALTSQLGQQAALRARQEETRLLYVGVTRARDYVVFAPPTKGELKWLQVLDGDQPGHVALPSGAANTLIAGADSFAARVSPMAVADAAAPSVSRPAYVRLTRQVRDRPALHRRPSGETTTDPYVVVERVQLGPRLPFVGTPDMLSLGEAVHAIFAADRADQPPAARRRRAESILERWGVRQVSAQDVLDACDRLNAHLTGLWPTGRLHRETPVFARLGDQLVSGRIDLLAEHDAGFAVIDHKSFPGSRDSWDARAVGYGPQLGLYAEALEAAAARPCDALYIHMPIVGALLRVARQPGGAA
jgi:ATP-dependent exoDNAse (exonuclease V) beta subunit